MKHLQIDYHFVRERVITDDFLVQHVSSTDISSPKTIKARADELVILDAPVDIEDLSERILEGLDVEYKELAGSVQARDTPISFDKLHEKLLNLEASLQNINNTTQAYFPASAHLANRAYTGSRHLPHSTYSSSKNTGWRSSSNTNDNNSSWRPTNTYNHRFSTSPQPGSHNSRNSQKPFQKWCC